jgi:hypothetical protein
MSFCPQVFRGFAGGVFCSIRKEDKTMHPILPRLAAHFGVRLADRSCVLNHIYDPRDRSIATRGRRRVFSDHDLLHEIAHFAIASERQKRLPEYGLGSVAIAGELGTDPDEVIIRDEEGNIQERMTHFLCILWGMAYGVSSELSEHMGLFPSWDSYLLFKTREENLHLPEELGWEALICLRETGWLDQLPLTAEGAIQ